MQTLEATPAAASVVEAINGYLGIYGHLGYSLDFAEPLPLEDPSGLLATLKTMVSDKDYNPKNHEVGGNPGSARRRWRTSWSYSTVCQYWQFRFRHWFTHRFLLHSRGGDVLPVPGLARTAGPWRWNWANG